MPKPYQRRCTSQIIQQRAQMLCQEMTEAEQILWKRLRNRRLDGLKFRRQHPLGQFIVDFYCPAVKLIVEVDGEVHQTQQSYDQARTDHLEASGYRLVRFTNQTVKEDTEAVLEKIKMAVRAER